MRKMLASDIDGTLLINGEVDEQSLIRLKELREQGHALILCTGRVFVGAKMIFENYDIDVDGLVLCNGALILDKDFKEEYALNIDKSIVASIHEHAREKEGFRVALLDGYELYVEQDTIEKDNPLIGKEGFNVLNAQELTEKYDVIKQLSIEQLEKCTEKAEELKNYINDNFGEHVIAYRNVYHIDVVPKGCSKALGIENVAGRFEIVEDDVFVIGDSWNDLSMFEKYTNSYTFTHCEEELKKSVNNIVDKFHNCVEDIIA